MKHYLDWLQLCADSLKCTAISLFYTAEQDRAKFIESLSMQHGLTHWVNRSCIYDSVIDLYKRQAEQIMGEFPFRVHFRNEKAIDTGGVARDMFSAFYEVTYMKLFDGATLLKPVIRPRMDTSVLPWLGTIMSHAYLVCGILPVRIAFPCLAAILLQQGVEYPEAILVEAFVNSQSVHDASIFKQAFQEIRAGHQNFSADIKSGLINILSRCGCREIPHPHTLKQSVIEVARFQFIMEPAGAIAMIRSGIPKQHAAFWNKTTVTQFHSIYRALDVTPARVLKMIDEPVFCNPNEERTFSYLEQYIGNMQPDEARSFVRFVTGCSVCSGRRILITFNTLEGLARRPIAHTCSSTLELPSTYCTYPEFSTEFHALLSDTSTDANQVWSMDAI